MAYKANPDVYALQGYDAAQMLGAGLAAVKGDTGEEGRADRRDAARRRSTARAASSSCRPQHNPMQDFYMREVKGNYNVVTGVAVKALADPGRGCRM